MLDINPNPFHDIDGNSDSDPGFNYDRDRSMM